MAEEESGFKVADRRKFTEDGELREAVVESPAEESALPGGAGATETRESVSEKASTPGVGQRTADPPMDFPTLVLSLTTTAMFQLGMAPNPATQKVEKDLPAARQTIDILEILQEKTQGNLSPEESRLLDQCLHDLKMNFVQTSQRVTL